MIRVVLTGSESTGKSSLAAQLANHYGAPLVPEFVRGYAERKGAPLDLSDHGPIARGQIALEDEATASCAPVIVQDTDLLSTVVYCEHYFGRCPEWIAEASVARRPDLYLLCDIDVAWVADGVRDRGHLRGELQRHFRDAVLASGAPSVTIGGDWPERFERAVDAVDRLRLESD